MKKLLLFTGLSLLVSSAFAQATARVQAIHNSADAGAATVDVWLTTPMGSSKLVEDFAFREATPFINAPAGVPITLGIAGASSTSINDTIAGLSFTYNLTANETYVLVAEGIVSTSGYSPLTPFDIKVYGMGQESAAMMGNTDVLVHHGSTDAPTVDVRERTLGSTIVNDASFGDFAGYLPLTTADYILDVQDATGSVTVASYQAQLATLNLGGAAAVVVASGFLNPAVNNNGPAFGLYVALPTGGPMVMLPAATGPTARVNIIHNCADAAASTVDVWVNGAKAIDDFDFRTATGYIDLPATTPLQVAIAPANSNVIGDTIPGLVFNGVNFGINEKYVVVANGIVTGGSTYSPNNMMAPFTLDVYGMGREEAAMTGNTDVLVHHGSTDAPTVDVDEISAGNLVNDASYGDFAGYLPLNTANYTLQVKNAPGTQVVKTYSAPLATLNLDDSALVVVASGFLNPAVNNNGPAFGLYVALASGGALIPLPEVVATGLDEVVADQVKIYPNPAQNVIRIDGLDLPFATVTMLDVTGRILETSQYNTLLNSTLDISNLKPGTYQLMISTNDQIISNLKFIKQ